MNASVESSSENPAGLLWFEDETFWEDIFSVLFPEGRFVEADEEVSRLQELTEHQTGRVLDLCCGPGRHSVALARRGFQVTGVDRSPFLLRRAQERAELEKLGIEWVQEDMRAFVRANGFDLVINLFTSFGYFATVEEDLSVLQNAFRSLKPGGHFVIDIIGKEILAGRFSPSAVEEWQDGTTFVQRREITDDWSRVRSHWMLIRNDKVRHFRFDHTLYSGRELTDLLQRAGFEKIKLFGSLQGIPYGPNAQRLIAVAAKEEA
jgi:SAM-dependent methyltransferase